MKTVNLNNNKEKKNNETGRKGNKDKYERLFTDVEPTTKHIIIVNITSSKQFLSNDYCFKGCSVIQT